MNDKAAEDKPFTIIVSDLHVGGGVEDPGDDHVHAGRPFSRFLNDLPEGRDGRAELFINGDFLEFAQVKQDAYTLGSAQCWCSEDESLAKLEVMLRGHEDIFDGLREFQRRGNRVTIAPGNHDVDLYWEKVQRRLAEAAGPVNIVTGEELYYRYDRRLVIGHGHQYDPANRFDDWSDPFTECGGERRLVMCPGTLFMVKFVNWLEEQYAFADNLKPITALARILWNESFASFVAAAKMLFRFAGEHPLAVLGRPSDGPGELTDIAGDVRAGLAGSEEFRAAFAELYREVRQRPSLTLEEFDRELADEAAVMKFLGEVVAGVEPPRWMPVFEALGAGVLGADDGTLGVIRSGISKEKEELRDEAILMMGAEGHEVVVFGHTHQPDEWRSAGNPDGGYFNPGSWTRYLDSERAANLSLEDLRREEDFPYQLNYIRVEQTKAGTLRADKITYEEQDGSRFAAPAA